MTDFDQAPGVCKAVFSIVEGLSDFLNMGVCVVDVFVVHMCECVSMDVCGCGWCGFDVFFVLCGKKIFFKIFNKKSNLKLFFIGKAFASMNVKIGVRVKVRGRT